MRNLEEWSSVMEGEMARFDVADRLKSAISGEERRAIKKHKKILFRKKCS